ncbi:MAG: superoxide dismutase [Hyphomicrobium sp.]|nr:superoxide dismutase [Hyphomicrobium sp.]
MTHLGRRSFLAGAAATATAAPFVRISFAETPSGPFSLPPLPYPANALEPHIDARTMELHHGKHHGAQVTNLNAALKDHGEAAKLTLDQLLAKLPELPENIRTAVRNNAGGHANHSMFWQIMGPTGGAPEGALKDAIDRDLGGLEKFQADFNTAGTKLFGSGWVFVVKDATGKLAITTRPNQDNPIMDGLKVVMGNDVWEHAYYLNYQNRRADYLKAWWNVVNWKAVGERYAAA